MLALVILFFLVLYIMCELMKYSRIKSLELKISNRIFNGEKLYNERIVFLKAAILIITVLLTIIYLFFTKEGTVERSQGVRGVVITLTPLAVFCLVSFRDIKRVIGGHNEKVMEKFNKQN